MTRYSPGSGMIRRHGNCKICWTSWCPESEEGSRVHVLAATVCRRDAIPLTRTMAPPSQALGSLGLWSKSASPATMLTDQLYSVWRPAWRNLLAYSISLSTVVSSTRHRTNLSTRLGNGLDVGGNLTATGVSCERCSFPFKGPSPIPRNPKYCGTWRRQWWCGKEGKTTPLNIRHHGR